MPTKNIFLNVFFASYLLYLYEQVMKNQGFSLFRCFGSGFVQIIVYPDLGGQKTNGYESGTLKKGIIFLSQASLTIGIKFSIWQPHVLVVL